MAAAAPPPAAGAAAQRPPTPRPVVLLLVGIPGSGKSTFAQALTSRSRAHDAPIRWEAVNQDSIRAGRPGTREQCIKAARAALSAGSCVVVDRCHVDPQQRAPFLQLAHQASAPAHALVLALPRAACLARAAAHQDHPGQVQGPGAARVVNSMASQLGRPGNAPAAAEGFTSVTAARSDAEVQRALEVWAGYGAPGWRGPREIPGAAAALAATAERAARAAQEKAAAKAAGKQAGAAAKAAPGGAAAGKHPAAAAPEAGAGGGGGGGAPPPSKRPRSMSPGGTAAADVSQAAGTAAAPAGPSPPLSHEPSPSQQQQKQQSQQQQQSQELPGGKKNAFAVLMAGARRSAQQQQQQPSPAKQQQQQQQHKPANSGGVASGVAASKAPAAVREGGGGGGRGFMHVLANVARDPEGHRGEQDVLHVDERVVAIADKYPKARTHLLIIARDPSLDSVSDLAPAHLPLLAHMRAVALQLIGSQIQHEHHHHQQQQQQQGAGGSDGAGAGGGGSSSSSADPIPRGWAVGFHAVPSLRRLHLHVLSTDMDSPALKNKKHWNSFCSPFLRPLDAVASDLSSKGRSPVDAAAAEALLKGPMRCNRCGAALANVPSLKAHIAGCAAPLP